jgi:hypothetical protein
VLRARSPHGVFHGRPPFDRQPARLSDHGPPQPAPELCGSRRYSEGPGLSVVGGATPGRHTGKRSKVVAAFTDVAAAMADAPGPVLSPDILEAYLRADHRPRLQPPDPVNRGPSPGTSNDYAPSDFVPGASPPADFPSESAVQPALAQLAAVPSAVRIAAGGGEDSEDVGDRRHPDPGAAFFPMPCDGAEILRASCSSAPPTRAQCTHLLLLCLPTWPLCLVSSVVASSIPAQPGGSQHFAPFGSGYRRPARGRAINPALPVRRA